MAKKATSSKAKSPATKKRKPAKRSGGSSKYGVVIFLVLAVVVIGLIALYMIGEKSQNEYMATRSQQQNKEVVTETPKSETSKKEGSKISTIEQSATNQDAKKPADESAAVENPYRNESITISESVDSYYFTSSFDFGWPDYTSEDQIVEHDAFTLSYNEATEQANWVVYKLTKENLQSSFVSRTDNFRPDPLVRTESAHPNDYKNSGFDRGHLAPAADFGWSAAAMSQSFFMSNMSPQVPSFNRGIWKKLENQVREWALTNDELYVVSGPIFEKKYKTIGKNKVGVPEAYYKIVLDIKEPEIKAIGFVIPNIGSKEELYIFATSIDEIEQMTGLDFFPLLPDELEKQLESTFDWSLWK